MNIIKPSFEIVSEISEGGIKELKHIERMGRISYKSEDKITEDGESAKKFIGKLIANGHESVLEHSSLSVIFITDRAVTHELVRHRLASFTQESQRYCNYSKDKFNNEVTFVEPWWMSDSDPIDSDVAYPWITGIGTAEQEYFKLLDIGMAPQDARAVLPNSTKTEIGVTANYREWRHILKLRCSDAAHPDIRRLMRGLTIELKMRIPVVFDDIRW